MIRKSIAISAFIIGITAVAGPAGAQINQNAGAANGNGSVIQNAAQGGAGGAGGAGGTGIGGGASVTNVNAPTNTNVGVNHQDQAQGQRQQQRQRQDQNNNQNIAPSQTTSIDASTNFDRYAPSIAAPGLTAAGTGVCLGSFSVGLTGPMAGAMFGKTVVDKGCEQRSGAALLYNMGHQRAALRVLAGESIEDALAAEGALPARVKAAKKADTAPVAALEMKDSVATTSTNFGAQGN